MSGEVEISHDWGHLNHLGRLPNGELLLLAPLHKVAPEGAAHRSRSFFCRFLFDVDGQLIRADVEEYASGSRLPFDIELQMRVHDLGLVERCDIEVRPFQIERHGVIFGLVPVTPDPDDEDDMWYVTLEPGADAVFYPPWDGTYETS